MKSIPTIALAALVLIGLAAGCGKPAAETSRAAPPPKHEHKPPHGGTPVVLGDEVYHVELVLDAASGKLQAYVFDGELENFIRSSVPSIEIDATIAGAPQALVLHAVANPATGETVGDTSLFEGQAEWLKNNREFDATLKSITVRGTTFSDVKFNFPKGNDKD
ncbi:MAG TPA: hypothetical protein VG734_21645 [Lacunisphaera sp.]|nr:hypothetical protein [Lacunisphaera sp.]